MPQPNQYREGGPEGFTQEQIDDALTALIAYAGNATAAHEYLEAEGKRAPTPQTLRKWSRTVHWQRYEELRDQFAGKREATLVHNYLDASLRATEAMNLAVDKAKGKLEAGADNDPARTAANLAMVARSATDKRLALQGRPTQIHETRDLGAILRSLAAKGVISVPDEPAQITEGVEGGDE